LLIIRFNCMNDYMPHYATLFSVHCPAATSVKM